MTAPAIEGIDAGRSLERWGGTAACYEDTDAYVAATDRPSGVRTVYENGVPIDIYADIKPGLPLVVFLNAASRRGPQIKLPIFSGFGVLPPGEFSRVCINDPVLYEDDAITLSWYAGSARVKAQSILPRLLESLIAESRPNRTIFIGGSGGGFASLYYSRLVEDAIAVVWNPQTNILQYVREFVAQYAKVAFGLASMKGLPAVVDTGVIDTYAQGHANRVLYLQNASDWHVKGHLSPFLMAQGYGAIDEPVSRAYSDRLYVHFGNWGEGHAQLPQEVLQALMAQLMADERSVLELFSPGVMRDVLARAESAIVSVTAAASA